MRCENFSQELSGPDNLPRAGEPRRVLPRGWRSEMPIRPGLQDIPQLDLLVSINTIQGDQAAGSELPVDIDLKLRFSIMTLY